MKTQIDRLLRYADPMDLPVSDLLPQRQERIHQMTMKKINEAQKAPVRRGRRPVTIFVAVISTLVLLCGSAFAAYELFDLSNLFGEKAEDFEEAVVTYAPTSEEVITAHTGRTEENFTTVQDYNFLLRGNVEVTDTLLFTSFQVSKVSEDIPNFTTTDLTIEIEGYETKSLVRWSGSTECIVLYATLEEPLNEDATLNFVVTDGKTNKTILEDTEVVFLEANVAIFSEPDPDADYVLDTVAMTSTTITVTGHFQKEFENYAAALDASGSYREHWPLHDAFIEAYDPMDGGEHEDLEGYLLTREVNEDGTFTLEWTFQKSILNSGTISFGGVEYTVPDAPTETVEIQEYTPNYGTSAETQDYRFTLESMVATSNVIYAIVDMEPITEYGASHMDLGIQELTIACTNQTCQGAGGTADSIPIETGSSMSRYLVYSLDSGTDVHHVGDTIHFQILDIIEGGDTAYHSYSLFDVKLENLVTATATAEKVSEGSDNLVDYHTVNITPFSLYLEGSYQDITDADGRAAADLAFEPPEILLTMKSGESHELVNEDWSPAADLSPMNEFSIVTRNASGEHTETRGNITQSFLFSQAIALEELDTITINGTTYQIHYEIG